MKHLLLITLLAGGILASITGYAQDRENKQLPVISPTALWTLNEATGWVMSSDGQWLSAKNKIKKNDLASNDPMQNTGHNAVGIDNFNTLTARDVTIEGKQFLLVTKSMSAGDYNHFLKDEDFFQKAVTVFFVIKKNSAEFSSGQNEAGPNYKLTLFYYGEVPTGVNTLNDIAVKINEMAVHNPWISTSQGTNKSVNLFYATVNGKPDVCRFFLMGIGDGVGGGRFLLPMNYDLFVYGAAEYINFKKAYFELPTAKFSGLIDLIKVK